MTLIKSISGIRGTIGGAPGDALTPIDIVKFTYAYCVKLRERRPKPADARYKVVVGKDARISGEMVEQLVCGSLIACGVDVVKAGFASTPTTEMAVIFEQADGGIILTASHNPKQWNALKLLNEKGEFLNAAEGAAILECADSDNFDFADVDSLGTIEEKDFTDMHLDAVLALEAVDAEAVRKAGFKVVLDAVNSVGGIIMPRLLKRLGVECVELNCEPTGQFAHNPEPLPANLVQLCDAVVDSKADLGISVDPDVDRLALICEDGKPFGEEYTLVSVADYLLSYAAEQAEKAGKPVEEIIAPYKLATVSNLSSSRALRDVTEKHGGKYYASAVGEVNVTTRMKECGALIGGEGNGGVIYPALHYGRDAMVGVALFLTNLAHKKCKVSELLKTYPAYTIAKNRIELSDKSLIDKILDQMKSIYAKEDINDIDGVKISFEAERKWVHLRRSNTEPIIRVYAEAPTMDEAEKLADEIIRIADSIIKG
ncbi:MAG: phosphoglucosamine mutase [Bacteroidetes bacterium]|uniref:Phosphoglucosamine mutase n=1 Tax=Candidatus Cryptobacteroides faecigallinarum TaxID=2840763 RepID=A0A9D9IKH7_9BACT|nr:phosphoglucosamine mutase [Candidatus Cryptobacteroides faecigallinarum]